MKSAHCDRGWEGDAHREGRLGPKDVESFERHCRTCAACAEGLARDEQLRVLGRDLPLAEPGELVLKRLRARILRDAATGIPERPSLSGRRLAFVSSLGMALVVAGLIGVRWVEKRPVAAAGSPAAAVSSAPLAGAVAPGTGAMWTQTREGGVEQVELETGTLRVHVRPQGLGERFLVRLPDGEIEVRGTTFDVTALGGSTRHVDVQEGTVVLRLRGSPDRSLGPGTSWSASEAPRSDTPTAAQEPARVGTAKGTAVSNPLRRARDVHDAEARAGDGGASAYVDAMQSFREGRYDRAATAFHAFTLAYTLAAEAEDASFLEALSLARAGRPDAAALAAERHLERFPRAFRRREASILVARAASARGRCDEALRALGPWMSPPDAEIQSVLAACGDGGATLR